MMGYLEWRISAISALWKDWKNIWTVTIFLIGEFNAVLGCAVLNVFAKVLV